MTHLATRLSAAALCLAAFAAPAAAGGFRIEGDDVKTAKLVFDSKGIDRSTAEGTARGLIEVYASIRDETLEIKFESMLMAELKAMLQPIMTSESYNELLGKKEERLRDQKQMLAKVKITKSIKLTGTSVEGGVTTIRYELAMTFEAPCKKCFRAEKPDPACGRCKGTGKKTGDRTTKGAVQVKQKDKLWLVVAMKKKCYRCEGTGTAKNRGPAPAVPPHKCSGANCPTCPAPPAAQSCTVCKGSGLRDDNFFRGPARAENLPTIDTSKPDLSSPEKAFASFGAALQGRRLVQKRLESQLATGFQGFVTFFCHPDHKPEPRVKKVRLTEYKPLEVHKDGDVARINYATAGAGAAPNMGTKVAGKVELRKGGDGNWRVSKLMTPCWSCSYQRKRDPNYQCKRCNDTGFQKATYLP